MAVMQWLRRSFITGFFVAVPLVVSLAAFVWMFGAVDNLTRPIYDRVLGRRIPGLGLLTTAVGILAVGVVATNVFGKRLLQQGERVLLRVPVFKTVYAPVKQLVASFSPDNESGFKRVVIVEGANGWLLGFLTKELTVDRGRGPEPMLAVYLPTNHLYLGDLVLCERSRAVFPEMTVEAAVRVFLTGGTALPERLTSTARPG